MNTIFVRRSGLQGFLLSAILITSMFAAAAPTIVGSASNFAASSAIQKLTSAVVESIKNVAASVNVIVQTTNNPQVMATVRELGGQASYAYKSIEALAASIPANKMIELASIPSVVRIYEDSLQKTSYNGAIEENLKIKVPLDPFTNAPALTTAASDADVEPLTIEDIENLEPSIYTNAYLTQAEQVWGDTSYGSGSLVVIIDTGVWSASPLLVGNVIGGVDLSADVGTPYQGYNVATNHYHGTACAHLLASHAVLRFRANHPWAEAIHRYDPTGTWKDELGRVYVTCTGIAPSASIYGIKVFPHTGAGAPTSTIMAGIDTAIQMKVNGTMDVDVISMSLGGGVGADGETPEELLVDAATAAGITVVAAAGNEGPAQLKVGRPASANTAIAVGAAMDPIHEHVWGDIYFTSYYGYPPGNGLGELIWYPHEEKSIVDFSSRGPAADGRVKPEVVATGSWCFLGIFADGYIRIGGGTSYSCPQVAGEAALLNAYIEANSLTIGPPEIKQAIYDGADPIPGFSAMEQGAGYVNALNSLNVIKSMTFGSIPQTWPHHFDSIWFPPIDTLCLNHGSVTVTNIVLDPAKYKYFAFWTSSFVDQIKITLSNVQLAAPEDQNPGFGDAGVLYMAKPERGGIDEYYFYGLYFTGDGQILYTTDVPFEPGVVRFVLAGDFSSYNPVIVGELTIEVTEVLSIGAGNSVMMYNFGIPTTAQVAVYPGKIERYCGAVKTGEQDVYTFNIPDAGGFAYAFLYWYRDWAHWATSDIDMTIINPDGTINVDGATGASPEAATMAGPGQYTLLIDGYEVLFEATECYYLEIVYISDSVPLWMSATFNLNCYAKVKTQASGVAAVWVYDPDFDAWSISGFVQVKTKCGCSIIR